MLVTNIDIGPRGIWLADGTLAMLDPGQSLDLDIAEGETVGTWFAFGPSEKDTQTSDSEPQASDDELRELRDAIEKATGTRPHHKTGRAKLKDMLANAQAT